MIYKSPLLEKSLHFAARIVKLCQYLSKEKKETIISKQIVRSGTSIGANANEAWISFAKTGAPTVEGADWKKYSTAQRDTMVIEKDQWSCVSDPSKTPRELLWKAFKDEPYHVW